MSEYAVVEVVLEECEAVTASDIDPICITTTCPVSQMCAQHENSGNQALMTPRLKYEGNTWRCDQSNTGVQEGPLYIGGIRLFARPAVSADDIDLTS